MSTHGFIARRLEEGFVQYGYCGIGGYYMDMGRKLFDLYNKPEMVDYLFGLGQLDYLGLPHSEEGGIHILLTTRMNGMPHLKCRTEMDVYYHPIVADKLYFYDYDKRWYYVERANLNIKIPLSLIDSITNNGEIDEFDYIHQVEKSLVTYIFGEYYDSDKEFQRFISHENFDIKAFMNKIKDEDSVYDYLYDYDFIFDYFDNWVLCITDKANTKIERFIVKPKTDEHIETIFWTGKKYDYLKDNNKSPIEIKRSIANNLLKLGKLTEKEISQSISIPIKEVKKLAKTIQ